MIKNLAELLDQLRTAEKIKIDELGIKHRPTIGREYEGLTATLLDESLFKELNLKVIRSSFIKTGDGTRSSEIDVMIIEGDGQEILYCPGQYDVRIEQVIAIIQVKKVLNKLQIEEAYHNLKSVYDLSNFTDNRPNYALNIFRDAYGCICQEDIIEGNKFKKSFSSSTKEQIFNILDYESLLPLRIVFAYEGYVSEYGLRKGFVRFLEENKSEVNDFKTGFGPINFPNLIINGDLSLIKANAMPYVGVYMLK